jgi:tetrahydromethanopterin S-methyltransferase subunit G
MQAFFVSVLLAVLENEKVQAMIRTLFDDAIATFKNDIDSRLDELEKKILDEVAALPAAILGDATKDVGILLREITGTKADIAGAVKHRIVAAVPADRPSARQPAGRRHPEQHLR